MTTTNVPNEKQQGFLPIYLHGKMYKPKYKNNSTYDGLLLTEEDCKRLISQFYEQKTKREFLNLNMEHKQELKAILGHVEDLYYYKDSLYTISKADPFLPEFNNIKKMLESDQKVGFSVELSFEYDGIDNLKTIDVTTLDPNKVKVKTKNLTGLAIVKFPDHEMDDTFVTSWVESNKCVDILTKDDIFKEYINSEEGKSNSIILEKYNSVQQNTIRMDSNEVNTERMATEEAILPNPTESTNMENHEKKNLSQTDTKKHTDGQSEHTKNQESIQIDSVSDLSKPTEKHKETTNLQTQNNIKMTDQSQSNQPQVPYDETALDAIVTKRISEMIKSGLISVPSTSSDNDNNNNNNNGLSQGGQSMQQKNQTSNKNQNVRTNNATKNKQPSRNTMVEDDNHEDEPNEMTDVNDDASLNDETQNDSQKQNRKVRFDDKSSSNQKMNNDNEDNSHANKKRKVGGDGSDPTIQRYTNGFLDVIQDLCRLEGIEEDPVKMREYFNGIKKEKSEYLEKLKEGIKSHYLEAHKKAGMNTIAPEVDREIERSFSDGTFRESPVVINAMAGLLSKEGAKSHRQAESMYRQFKQGNSYKNNGNMNNPSDSVFDNSFTKKRKHQRMATSSFDTLSGLLFPKPGNNGFSSTNMHDNTDDMQEDQGQNDDDDRMETGDDDRRGNYYRNNGNSSSSNYGDDSSSSSHRNRYQSSSIGMKNQQTAPQFKTQHEKQSRENTRVIESYISELKRSNPHSAILEDASNLLTTLKKNSSQIFSKGPGNLYGENNIKKFLMQGEQVNSDDYELAMRKSGIHPQVVQAALQDFLGPAPNGSNYSDAFNPSTCVVQMSTIPTMDM